MRRCGVAVLVSLSLVLAGCGARADGPDLGQRPDGTHVTIRVPAGSPTISAAVSLAQPGDLVACRRRCRS